MPDAVAGLEVLVLVELGLELVFGGGLDEGDEALLLGLHLHGEEPFSIRGDVHGLGECVVFRPISGELHLFHRAAIFHPHVEVADEGLPLGEGFGRLWFCLRFLCWRGFAEFDLRFIGAAFIHAEHDAARCFGEPDVTGEGVLLVGLARFEPCVRLALGVVVEPEELHVARSFVGEGDAGVARAFDGAAGARLAVGGERCGRALGGIGIERACALYAIDEYRLELPRRDLDAIGKCIALPLRFDATAGHGNVRAL